ncbi:MAG TPA: peptidylprolyl isomerase [Candidatus Limnocylindria bacterium]|nr:peptidylprolyl isomerase [Candidatus Limnocylindria bacterium]
MKKKIKKLISKRPRRNQEPELKEAAPRITNETVAAHREEVLGTARKYIYPLQHSKHRIVLISAALFIVTIVAFFTYSTLALYKFQSSSTFLYRVTQVFPFPIARAGSRFVGYENYLFELRHYTHYYENQLDTDFTDPKNTPQLEDFKRRALEKVVTDAYVKQLAEQNGITVSPREVDDQITIVRNQNRLGGNERVFEDVLKDYWGWSVTDFKRSLRQELLAQKVAAALDTTTTDEARTALAEIRAGKKFSDIAKKYSDDQRTKNNGGEFPRPIDRTDRDLAAQTTDALFKLRKGQVSELVNTGYALEILKNLEVEGDTIQAAHILFQFKDIAEYVDNLKEQKRARLYLNLPEVQKP